MRVKDLKYDGKSIISYIDAQSDFDFIDDAGSLDIAFLGLHGGRVISTFTRMIVCDIITDERMVELADTLISMYGVTWTNMYDLSTKDITLDNYRMKTIETIDDDGEVKSNTVSENKNVDKTSTSAFNVDDFSNDNLSDRMTEDIMDSISSNSNYRNRIVETVGNNSNLINDRRRLLNIVKDNFIREVFFKDIANIIGLLIY